MVGRGRGRGRGKKQSPKKASSSKSSSKLPSKQSTRKKKDPPHPPLLHVPSDDESACSHDEEESPSTTHVRSLTPTSVRSRSASRTSRPSSPVGSLAGDVDGPGEEEDAAKKNTAKKSKKPCKECKISDKDIEDDLVEWFRENDSLWNTQ